MLFELFRRYEEVVTGTIGGLFDLPWFVKQDGYGSAETWLQTFGPH